MDTPLSKTTVSLKLSQICKRFEELMQEEHSELMLEDTGSDRHPGYSAGAYNPYNHT